MFHETLRTIFNRDVNKLITELEQYHDEKAIWCIEGDIANSAGNITLHLIGNINNYIGMVLGRVEYVRDRAFEFSAKDIPRQRLVEQLHNTITIIDNTLDKLLPAALDDEYPIMVFGDKMTTGFFLVHLATHLNYHLGQVNYHRRLLDKGSDTV